MYKKRNNVRAERSVQYKKLRGNVMKNVLVCVTTQKSCKRLIRYGRELAEGCGGELMVVHIAEYELSKLKDPEVADNLEYLYRKALEYGTNLFIVRSGNVAATLISLTTKNNISKIVMGQTRHRDEKDSTTEAFRDMLHEEVEVIVVPEEEEED